MATGTTDARGKVTITFNCCQSTGSEDEKPVFKGQDGKDYTLLPCDRCGAVEVVPANTISTLCESCAAQAGPVELPAVSMTE